MWLVGAGNRVTPCDLGIRVSGRRAGPGALDTTFSTTLFQPGLTLGTLLRSDTGSSAPPSRLAGKARKPGVLAASAMWAGGDLVKPAGIRGGR